MRLPFRKSVLAALAVTAPIGAIAAGASSRAEASGPAFPAHYAAPYLQVDSGDVGDIQADMRATGLKYYTLAFLTPKSGCTAEWEDDDEAVASFTSEVSALQAAGGNVEISFGGESGGELSKTCTSVSNLEAAYANVVNTYGVTRLDFDIEGNALNDTAENTRRDEALAALEKANPSVQVDFTIPVDPSGLESNALNLLKNAKADGVKVTIVNIMTMDFGAGDNPLTDSESAATGTEKQLAGIYSGESSSDLWGMLGLTPIAGKNDPPDNEVFTQADASSLESWASSKGVGELAFWEVDQYDKPAAYAYSRIFNQITG